MTAPFLFNMLAVTLVTAIVAVFLFRFLRFIVLKAIKSYDPFYGSRLKIIKRCETPEGCQVFVYGWRQGIEKDDEPDAEAKKIGIVYPERDQVYDLTCNKDLPKTRSVSAKMPDGSILVIHVGYRTPHELERSASKQMPKTQIDCYLGIRECYVRNGAWQKALDRSTSLNHVPSR
ncbi:hypothetical protein KW799_00895 [Candidatus Parcubacteria bacterium]|nr:hypothetical protein [Candidatus Parcubacteria bacterium]